MKLLSTFFSQRAEKKSIRQRRAAARRGADKQKFVGSPLFNVSLMLLVMFAVSGAFKLLEWRRMSSHAQIQISDSLDAAEDKPAKNNSASASTRIFAGEVFDTSIRLRELGALGFAVCLSVVDEAAGKRQIPGSINALMSAVTARGLLPPGIKIENGEIQSNTSKIFVRYSPAPVQLEFVSLPLDARFGPALMLRFPLSSADGKNIAYFQSVSTDNVALPAPFAPAHEVVRSGWTLESWRGMTVDDKQNFAAMLAEEQEKLKTSAPAALTR